MILLRLLICLVLLYLPFILFIAASRNKDNALWVLFPLYGTIPAVMGALLVFVPIENYLNARALGHMNNVAIPIVGSLLIVLFLFVVAILSGNLLRHLSRISKDGLQFLASVSLWSFLGGFWGVLWRLSDWLSTVIISSVADSGLFKH